jgi:outer membrane biosynthesis protein TonB
MTDQDRGAYAPLNDAPLAFDPRRAGVRSGPPPLTLIAGVVVLMAFVAGAALLYRHGVRRHGQPPQIVGAPIGDTKSLPPASAQTPSDATAGLQVYKTEVPPPTEMAPPPAFAPPPEQPLPRPVTQPPAPPPVSVAALRAAEPAPVAPPVPALKVAPPAPALKVTPKIAPAKAKVAPTPKVVVAAAAPSPAVAATAGGTMAQIGSESSSALANKILGDVARKFPGPMAGKSRKVETFNKDGKVFYRALVAGFASRSDAVSFCATVKAAGGGCILR